MPYTNMFIDYTQNQQINQVSATAEQAKTKSDRHALEIKSLRRQVDRMALANQAIWELLREVHGLSDDHLLQRMEEIDLRDGSADGKIGAQVINCPKCRRKTNATRPNCIFCGAPTKGESDHVFG